MLYKAVLWLLFGGYLALLQPTTGAAVQFCGVRNEAFAAGEKISYTVYYNLAGVYVNAGAATFTTALEQYNGKPVYHLVGAGQTHTSYDWIYKVRDRYESYIDTATLQPLKFIRNVSEGSTKKYENVSFNKQAGTALTSSGAYPVPACVHDVLSTIYYARNINFNQYKAGDRIPFTLFLENEVHHLYVRYLGKESIKTRYGTFSAIKFKPLLIKGTIFAGGEDMTVWVSNDNNRVPVRIESPIIVGSIKVDLMRYQNLRYPLTALKKLRG